MIILTYCMGRIHEFQKQREQLFASLQSFISFQFLLLSLPLIPGLSLALPSPLIPSPPLNLSLLSSLLPVAKWPNQARESE